MCNRELWQKKILVQSQSNRPFMRSKLTLWLVCFVMAATLVFGDCLFAQESAVMLASSSALSSDSMQVRRWPVELRAGQFHIHSTVSTQKLEPVLYKLSSLAQELTEALAIKIDDQPIHIVVLESRESLDAYVKRLLPLAPSRRALYIRHRGPGLVLTFMNPTWITDARHECTHALLDASTVRVPQWLDEGLAEYFETDSGNPLEHATHRAAVRSQLRYGQVADLAQLERTDSNSILTAKDYRDAWSVTAFALNASQESKVVFQRFLQDLQNDRAGGFLSHRLQPSSISWREEFANFFRQ